MWRMALSPRNGIEPWAMRPWVSISAHQTPRWPRQMRSLLSGSGMMTCCDAVGREIALLGEVGDAAIAAGLLVGGAGDLDGAGEVRDRVSMNASAAMIEVARPPFMSQAPRP